MQLPKDSSGCSLLFANDYFSKELVERLPFSKTNPVLRLNKPEFNMIRKLVDSIKIEYSNKLSGYEAIIKAHMNAFMQHLLRIYHFQHPEAKEKSTHPVLVIHFMDLLKQYYIHHYNVEQYADKLNNSRDTVSMGLIRLGKTPDLTPFSINILDLRPTLMPDTIEIYFSTGYPNWNDSLFIEPELKIDNIDITLPRSIIADCNLFRVEDVRLDTAKPNTLYIKIFNANCEEQITHPFIHSIKDNIGNTITNERGLDLYQHLGYTILTYPIQTSLQSMPTNFNCTVYLSYNNGWWGDNRSVCILPFQSVVTDFKIRENKKNVISVFPNPFDNKFTIQSNPGLFKNEIFKLNDRLGEQVFYKKITSREIIDIPDLKNGIYFYSIEDDKGILQRGKLIGQ